MFAIVDGTGRQFQTARIVFSWPNGASTSDDSTIVSVVEDVRFTESSIIFDINSFEIDWPVTASPHNTFDINWYQYQMTNTVTYKFIYTLF